jgi:hypothetical protein
MADEQEKPEELTETPEEALRRWEKERDDALVGRYLHFEDLAVRMLSHEGKRVADPAEVRHMALILLLGMDSPGGLLGMGFHRFRSRYAGSYD